MDPKKGEKVARVEDGMPKLSGDDADSVMMEEVTAHLNNVVAEEEEKAVEGLRYPKGLDSGLIG